MQHRIFYHRFIFICAENNAYRWVIIRLLLQIIKHTYVHIHLSDVLMRQLMVFQIYQHKTFQNIIIKNQINVIPISE